MLYHAYVAGHDRNLYSYEIVNYGVQPGEPKPADVLISSLAVTSSNKLLFGGICDESRSAGAIRCYPLPLTHGKHADYQAHDERGIEKMRITQDDKFIITAGRDGCVMIFEIKDKDAKIKYKEGY